MRIGYIRVSTVGQNIARQEEIMTQLRVEKLYIDKASGKNTDREQLREMLAFIREGDTVIVESISRFARNTRDLLELIEKLEKKSVAFISRKESIDTSTPPGRFMLTVFAAIAELEREHIRERQREGIELAKARGVYKGRTPIDVDPRLFGAVCGQWRAGEITARQAMARLGLKPNTFYRRVRAAGAAHSPQGESAPV